MPKQTTMFSVILRHVRTISLVALAFGVAGSMAISHADQYDDQINALRNQNVNIQGVLNGLTSQASSFQDAINQLQAQISAVEAQIATNQAEQAQVNQQIADEQLQIDQKREELSATIKAMYIDGQTTTIEELATSNNLSDYVDKEENRQKVQANLDATIK